MMRFKLRDTVSPLLEIEINMLSPKKPIIEIEIYL